MNKVGDGVVPKSVQEFVTSFTAEAGGQIPHPGPVNAICEKLCRVGCLSGFGAAFGGLNIDGIANRYMCFPQEYLNEAALSRRLDCIVYGFPCIYDVFKSSILPIVHLTADDVSAIGTGFVIDPVTLQTAAHCIEGATELSIRE